MAKVPFLGISEDVYDELERLKAENAKLKDTNRRLNKRCQLAECAANDNIEKCKRAGVSFGRSLANYGCAKWGEENDKLKKEYWEASKMVDKITSNKQCESCNSKGSFPSLTCCECVFDSIYKLAIIMDEKAVELALKGESDG